MYVLTLIMFDKFSKTSRTIQFRYVERRNSKTFKQLWSVLMDQNGD